MKVALKICGMKMPENVADIVALAPDYIGFIFYPGSKRFIGNLDPKVIRDIPLEIKSTGVFVNQKVEDIVKAIGTYNLTAVQLHGNESPEECVELSVHAQVIKAFGINEDFDFDTLLPYAGKVHYFLFDTQSAQHGGTGKRFSWTLLEKYTLDTPYFLSGGIGSDSISELLQFQDERLYAIDVNSRFETAPGIKNIEELRKFKTLLCG